MSSSAFFIEAAANTSGSCPGPARAKWPIRAGWRKGNEIIRQDDALWRSMRVRGAIRARKSGVGEEWNATGGSAVPAVRGTYDPPGHRGRAYSIVERGKGFAPRLRRWNASFGGRHDCQADRTGLDTANLQDKGFGRISNFTLLRMPSQSVTPLDADRLEKSPVLHHIDPAGGRQTDGVSSRLQAHS